MAFTQSFVPLAIDDIASTASSRKEEGWRFVQILCINTENGIDMLYSFEKDGELRNYEVKGIAADAVIPSITPSYLEAFVFENESHDLFGVQIRDIAIDFNGRFYDLAESTPMTVISPAQKTAREKAAKIAAAKAAKEAKAAAAKSEQADSGEGQATSDDAAQAELEAKLADMDPEKAAKVRAAMEAKARKQAAASDAAKEGE